ncbi:hypothetical protein E4O04_13325 [Treponema sp. OMZ 799]|uniref:S41 family peptidase n=1 Tax=Treponema sp. OMZ 799 TaxID=2563668 RepID=UPI0020A4F3A2|nr:S41 family peptidase [Treponema sp. OMZ 799]UTC78926.1 hypothetical protein E4O04_13325 [Treponema sp. OMZ 799]
MIKKILGIFLVINLLFSCSKKMESRDNKFMSLSQMEKEYEYFWKFIYEAYPYKNVCIRNGIDLENIEQIYKNNLESIKNEFQYYKFYKYLIAQITGHKYYGHFYPLNYTMYYYDIKTWLPEYDDYELVKPIQEDENIIKFYDKGLIEYETVLYKNFTSSKMFCNKPYSNTIEKFEFKPLKENEIFYIKIPTFMNSDDFDWEKFHDVWKEICIKNYKHIIIDVQNNMGGSMSNCEDFIIYPFLKENKIYKAFVMYRYTKFSDKYIPYFFNQEKQELEISISKNEILDLPKINQDDKEEFNIFYTVFYKLNPINSSYNFEGKFWVLVDSNSFSASDRFASFCRQTKFATVVGYNTGGDGLQGFHPVFLKLPDSGLIIKYDMFYGLNPDGSCNSEVGTAPDIYNLPGKDALETCLEEIRKLGEKTN